MATFDQLPAEQRAIIELVLKRGQSYEELSTLLNLPATRVRELARAALVDLTPATARRVDEDWRGQVADYVLAQQSGPEATATRAHLKHSEPARTWALSLLDALDPLYENGDRPEIPEGEPAARPRERRPATAGRAPGERFSLRPSGGGRPLSPEAAAIVRRRRLIAGGAGVLALLFILLIWPIGLVTGGDDEQGGDDQAAEQVRVVGNPILLRGVRGSNAEGSAVIAERGNERVLIVQAQGLRPTPQDATEENPGFAYEVWLYNSRGEARSLGAQLTDAEGNLQGAAPLPDDFEQFRWLDMSRENIDQNAEHSGRSVLRGRLADINTPIEEQQRRANRRSGGGDSGGQQSQGEQQQQQQGEQQPPQGEQQPEAEQQGQSGQ